MPIPIYPTYSGVEGVKKFPPRELVCDMTGRIRFVNVQAVGAAASPQKGMRILRGIMTVANPAPEKGTAEWQWEANGYPMKDFYVWHAIVLHPPKDCAEVRAFSNCVFLKDRLERLAMKMDMEEAVSLMEHLAHFMVGCLTAFGARYQAAIAEDMTFERPAQPHED